ELHQRTFHPDLPGVASLGQYSLHGPYFAVLELQARWIAMAWAGEIDGPSDAEMRAGVEQYRTLRPAFDYPHILGPMLAAEMGVAPRLASRPELTQTLFFGPLAPAQ